MRDGNEGYVICKILPDGSFEKVFRRICHCSIALGTIVNRLEGQRNSEGAFSTENEQRIGAST